MIMSKRDEFCAATAIGGSTGRRLLGDVVDLKTPRNIGADSARPHLVVQVSQTFTSGGAGTLQLEFASDAAAAIAVDGSASVHFTSPAYSLAQLVAGRQLLSIPLPDEAGTPYERFIGIIGNVGTAAMTAGALNAFITLNPPNNKAYADGVR